jgi:hypothetical protein
MHLIEQKLPNKLMLADAAPRLRADLGRGKLVKTIHRIGKLTFGIAVSLALVASTFSQPPAPAPSSPVSKQ